MLYLYFLLYLLSLLTYHHSKYCWLCDYNLTETCKDVLILSMSGKATGSTKSQRETRTHQGLNPHRSELDHAQRLKRDEEAGCWHKHRHRCLAQGRRSNSGLKQSMWRQVIVGIQKQTKISTSAWYESEKNAFRRDLESCNLLWFLLFCHVDTSQLWNII